MLTSYFHSIRDASITLWTGFSITFKHFRNAILRQRTKPENANVMKKGYFEHQNGISTLTFPHEELPLPHHARYELHNEIEDCIVCNKCAEICPVNCIEIESIRAVGQAGIASDGTPIRFYAAKFDIDMAKCCYCGLCTTVCPTECLTMTPHYDFSTSEVEKMNFKFSNLTPEEAEEKRKAFEEHQNSKKKPTNKE